MAFSQKHTGKVFVPWFNSEEWRTVYDYITSFSHEKMKKALLILKIWKNRTSLLSAGVEGTLILLETIVSDLSNMTEYQIVQIYSITLLRFLNISAANNNKQGTFNRTVSKSDLPKWLIDIRHDIAHDNKLPSQSMLELALSQSLKWLIEKYWNIENPTISDYTEDIESSNAKILDSLNVYVRLNLNLYRGINMNEYDEALMEKINYLASKRYNKSKTDVQGQLMILEEILRQSFSDVANKNIVNKVAKILVDENALLSASLEINEEGNKFIPTTFKKLWLNLLNILYKNEGFLAALLNQLWLFISNGRNEITNKIATLWICDLLNGLLKVQSLREQLQTTIEQNPEQGNLTTTKLNLKNKLEKKFPEYKDCIEFESFDSLFLVNLQDFEKSIYKNPNVHILKFIDRLMKFNKNPEDYIVLMKRILFHMYGKDNISNIGSASILTINDLPFDVNSLENDVYNSEENHSEMDVDVVVPNITLIHVKRWNLIQDTLAYKNCPLGLLHYQNRMENPLLIKDG